MRRAWPSGLRSTLERGLAGTRLGLDRGPILLAVTVELASRRSRLLGHRPFHGRVPIVRGGSESHRTSHLLLPAPRSRFDRGTIDSVLRITLDVYCRV